MASGPDRGALSSRGQPTSSTSFEQSLRQNTTREELTTPELKSAPHAAAPPLPSPPAEAPESPKPSPPPPAIQPSPPSTKKKKKDRRKRGDYVPTPPTKERISRLTGFTSEMCDGPRGLRKLDLRGMPTGRLSTRSEISLINGVTPLLSHRRKPAPQYRGLQEGQPQSVSEWLSQWSGSQKIMPNDDEEPEGLGGTATALSTLHTSPFKHTCSSSSRSLLGQEVSRRLGPAGVRTAARLTMSAREKNQQRAAVDLAGRKKRRQKAMREMEDGYQKWAKNQKGNKLELTPEEMLERQTTQIGKVLRSAIAANRSLGGQAMNDIESTFRAMDTDGSGDLDYEEFDQAMTRLGMGLTDKQVKQCIAVLDTDGDGEVSLSEFMVLVNEPMKSAVKKIKAVNAIKSFSKE